MTRTKSTNGGGLSLAALASILVAAGGLAACAEVSPEQVHSSNPSVTYNYNTDQQLLQAKQKAATFCRRYQSTAPGLGAITKNPDGTKRVSFECVPVAAMPPMTAMATPPAAAPFTYTYHTGPELLMGSQDAQAYCFKYGEHSRATITTNPDGSKTAAFQCVS